MADTFSVTAVHNGPILTKHPTNRRYQSFAISPKDWWFAPAAHWDRIRANDANGISLAAYIVQTALSFGKFLRQQRLGLNRGASRLGSYERLPARIGRAITQEEVAEAVGGSRNWYALLELDARRTSATLANRLADVFNLEGTEKLKLISLAVPGLVLHYAGVTDPAGRVLEGWAPRSIC